MRTENFYKTIIILLLLLNLGTLGYLWTNSKQDGDRREGHPPPPDRMIIERLKLDDKQIEQFEELKHEHHSQMVEIQQESGRLHTDLFALLKQDNVDTVAKSRIMGLLDENNHRKEEVTDEHFRKLRLILNPEQQTKFDTFVAELGQRIMGPHREGRP